MLTVDGFQFKLSSEIEYNEGKTNTLYLYEPLGAQQRQYEILDALLTKGLLELALKASKKEKTESSLQGDDKEASLEVKKANVKFARAYIDDIEKFNDEFDSLLLSGTCYLDSDKKHKIKSGWLQMLRPHEKKELTCEYAARYIFPKLG